MFTTLVAAVSLLFAPPEVRAPLVGGRCGAIHIVGNTDTPSRAILRAVVVSPGERLTFDSLAATRQALRRCVSLHGVEVVLERPRGQGPFWDMTITVVERRGCGTLFELVELLLTPPVARSFHIEPLSAADRYAGLVERVIDDLLRKR
jgi:hypothetical protein